MLARSHNGEDTQTKLDGNCACHDDINDRSKKLTKVEKIKCDGILGFEINGTSGSDACCVLDTQNIIDDDEAQ